MTILSFVWRLGDCDDGCGLGVACHITTLSSMCVHMVMEQCMCDGVQQAFSLDGAFAVKGLVGRGWGVCVWLAKWDGHVTRMSHGNGNDCVSFFRKFSWQK